MNCASDFSSRYDTEIQASFLDEKSQRVEDYKIQGEHKDFPWLQTFIIIIIIIIISFMQGIYTHIPETNYVPRE